MGDNFKDLVYGNPKESYIVQPGDSVWSIGIKLEIDPQLIILRNNLKPVFCDINLDDYTICAKDLEKKINKKTKAIIPVHISGRGTNIKNILKIAKAKKLFVIEDAAEAFMS